MRIVCSHDEASFLRIMCDKYAKCPQCVLYRICEGNLNKLLYTNPQAAALITKNNYQAVSFKEEKPKKAEEVTTSYHFTITVDSNGCVTATNEETGETQDVSDNVISSNDLIGLIM